MKVKCPRCGKPTEFSPENPARPFCSDRCKLIDLGQWAEGKYAIPAGPAAGTPASNEISPGDLDIDEFDGHESGSSDSSRRAGFPGN